MPARDIYHHAVKAALTCEGLWNGENSTLPSDPGTNY